LGSKTLPRIRAKRLPNARSITIAVGIGVISGKGDAFIYRATAVVVNTVADFSCTGIDFVVVVVAITGLGSKTLPRIRAKRLPNARSITIAVGIGVISGEGESFIGRAVAIVVNAVADFSCTWIDFVVVVVAITGLGSKTLPRIRAKRLPNARSITIAVGIGVISGKGDAFIYRATAVVVNTVADFSCTWIDFVVVVVAITGLGSKTLPRIRAKRLPNARAITIAVGIGVISGEGEAFIYRSTAVVVNAVANFGCTWIDFVVVVVAITGLGSKTLPRILAKRLPNARSITIAVGIGVISGEGEAFIYRALQLLSIPSSVAPGLISSLLSPSDSRKATAIGCQ
jgi:adenylate kinase